jgi:outer membrane biosynthesis protein TonB
MMRKPSLAFFVLLALIASSALADTIHLKNGSLLKGKVASFADDQFVVMLDTGSGRYLSKAIVYVGDVARIEFDSTSAASGAAVDPAPLRDATVAAQPETPAKVSASRDTPTREATPADPQPRNNPPAEVPATVTQPVESPRDTTPAQPQPSSAQPITSQPKEPEPLPEKHVEKPSVTLPSATTAVASESPDSERAPRKLSGPVRTVLVDVVGKRDWTSSGLIVKRGDRIHITATGTVTLDPASGRTSGPEGLPDSIDPKKLMPDQPTGALIGVVGADNDDFIFIGRSTEFVAARDGLLFLSVNEGTLADNSGIYKAVIEVQVQRK